MVEYGLDVSITEKTRNWIRALFGKEPTYKIRGKIGAKTPPASTSEGNIRKSSDENYPEDVANLLIDQSKQDEGRKKDKARERTWYGMRGASKHDEENGMGRGK